jgi:hypothetical protein
MSVTAYPLAWPQGWPRTKRPQRARFDMSFERARRELQWEVQRLGARYPILSTNIPLRLDGQPYASAREPDDAGVALYFERAGKQMVFACDRWDRVRDNIRAIEKTIDAMRGIERWGASDMMERAFAAFEALPPPFRWHDVLELPAGAGIDEVMAAHRRLSVIHHPDRGGSTARMAEINAARDAALKELKA